MIIKKIKYKPFNLKLKSPFISAKQLINERIGFIIQVEDELGHIACGEVSPLPDFSKETFEESERDINLLTELFNNKEVLESFDGIEIPFSTHSIVCSVRFGFEQAILNLIMKRNPYFTKNELNIIPQKELSVNAVIGKIPREDVITQATMLFDNGYRTFKVKVGREKFDDDLTIIRLLKLKFNDQIKLRLDANGKWDADNAFNHLQELAEFNIEYIEDPCPHINCMMKLSSSSKVPIAVDESINSTEQIEQLISHNKIKFFVVKPMILGSISKIIRLIKLSEQYNINIIISSAFESNIGRSILVYLASLTKHNFAHGLATSDYFESDLGQNLYGVKKGMIQFDINKYPPTFHI